MSHHSVKVASAQYDIGQFASFDDYRHKVTDWVERAVEQGAQLLVFPEYASMELTSLFSREIQQDLAEQLVSLQSLVEQFKQLYAKLANQHQIYIQPGSFPVAIAERDYRNRAFLFAPEGEIGYQDKLIMTRFEDEQWFIGAGHELKVFQLPFGKLAINICYDSEFPLLAQQQVASGADVILVPSCTDTLAGYYRVQIGCRARALENQCYVVQSPTVGEALWSPAVDENCGAAAIYTPVDYGFPDDGILAMGPLDTPQWVFAELDFSHIQTVRESGQVFNFRDWPKQQLKTLVE